MNFFHLDVSPVTNNVEVTVHNTDENPLSTSGEQFYPQNTFSTSMMRMNPQDIVTSTTTKSTLPSIIHSSHPPLNSLPTINSFPIQMTPVYSVRSLPNHVYRSSQPSMMMTSPNNDQSLLNTQMSTQR